MRKRAMMIVPLYNKLAGKFYPYCATCGWEGPVCGSERSAGLTGMEHECPNVPVPEAQPEQEREKDNPQ